MIVPIKTIHDLRNEIVRLETLSVQQEVAIKQRFSSPSTIYKTLLTVIPKSSSGHSGKGTQLNGILNQDLIATVSRFLLPLTLNKTLFKESGFITRSIVTFLSKKASEYINQDSVNTGWDKIKTMVADVKVPDTVKSKTKTIENFIAKLLPAKKSIKATTPVRINTPIVVKKID
ncbi:hypothetical protein [uncultured Mucilaginibacter sp.]|uniref:hypothetical protein n=1 Tax=uncultured Mucilaginibacter sp. TaxID=797541 RepID=UPI002625BE34|nr:hypothetical protein [uncultured Mucilaginibacter sp.]